MRWGTPNDSVEGVNFDELFAAQGFNTVRFLKIDNVVEEVKRQNDKVTEKLITNTEILRELMCISMKPYSYSHPQIAKITNQHTHKAIEILTNLTQQFSDFLFSSAQSKQKCDDDQVITDDISPSEDIPINPLFLELMSLLDQEKPLDETALSYLVKIVTSLSYQKPKQVIMALFKADNVSMQVFQHFYSRSIFQWFTRLLQIQDSASFYEKQKLMLFKQCIKGIQAEQNEDLLLQKLQNYESIFEILLQKIDDRFDKAKFSSMVKQLLTQQDCLTHLFKKINAYQGNYQILQQILSIFEIYLRFSSNHRSLNNSKNSDNLENSIYQIRLNGDSIKEIKSIVVSKSEEILSQNCPKTLARKYLELIKAIIIFDSDFITEMMTKNFVSQLIDLTINNPHNNILHNLVKDILIESINRSFQHTSSILMNQKEVKFVEIIRNIRAQNSSKQFQYENQFFHVFQVLCKKGEQNVQFFQNLSKQIEGFEEIINKAKEKEKFYSKLIGGNARKQSSCWGDSSAEIIFDKIFPNGSNSDKKIDLLNPKDSGDYIEGNQSQHFFDCGGLPLDSDSSRDQGSGNLDIENCLSPRSPRSPSNTGRAAQILLTVNEEQGFTLQRENSDIRISLDLPQSQTVNMHNNSDLFIEPEEYPSNLAQDNSQRDDQLTGRSFNTFFVTYQSFQLDEVLSEIE